MLPKVHKQGKPGRPIGYGIGSVTEKISAYVDEHLRKFICRICTDIKDTTHFLNIMKQIKLDHQDILVTIDVRSLYTRILHNTSISSLTQMMDECGTDIQLSLFIYSLAQQVLTRNYSKFKSQLYRQK